jgi:hypothetical protein
MSIVIFIFKCSILGVHMLYVTLTSACTFTLCLCTGCYCHLCLFPAAVTYCGTFATPENAT